MVISIGDYVLWKHHLFTYIIFWMNLEFVIHFIYELRRVILLVFIMTFSDNYVTIFAMEPQNYYHFEPQCISFALRLKILHIHASNFNRILILSITSCNDENIIN